MVLERRLFERRMMFVFTCGNRGLLVYSLNDKKEATFHKQLDEACKTFKCSPDGKILAYVNKKGVHLIEVPSLNSIRVLPFEKVHGIEFSPKASFISICTTYLCKPGEQPQPNLHIVDVSTGSTVYSYVQRKQLKWEPHWFNDESYLARYFSNTVMLYDPSDFSKHAKQINIERVADICLSPSTNKKYFSSYIPTSGKGQPAFCRLYNIDQPGSPLASKSFFKCDSVQTTWNQKGRDLLILATNEVDKTNASYYGDQALHYANVKGDSCFVQLKKKGPIYATEWNNDTFCVVYGYMPSKTTIFNLKCDPVWDLEEGHRNSIYFNPHGNILLTAGFGNLQGTVETWDVEQQRRICLVRMPDTTHLEFAADGEHFLTATHTPRLRVNNGFKVWHYSGALKTEIASAKDEPNGFEELWFSTLQPQAAGECPKPTIVFKRVEGIAQALPKASKQAYVPPGLRAAQEEAKAKNKKQKKKPKAAAEAPQPTVDPAVLKADDDERRARAIKKKLSQIHVLKQRLEAGEELESEQLAKISKENELTEELKKLEL